MSYTENVTVHQMDAEACLSLLGNSYTKRFNSLNFLNDRSNVNRMEKVPF